VIARKSSLLKSGVRRTASRFPSGPLQIGIRVQGDRPQVTVWLALSQNTVRPEPHEHQGIIQSFNRGDFCAATKPRLSYGRFLWPQLSSTVLQMKYIWTSRMRT
jgi:hypothetical protein